MALPDPTLLALQNPCPCTDVPSRGDPLRPLPFSDVLPPRGAPSPAPLCPLTHFLRGELALKFNAASQSSSPCPAGSPGPEPGSGGVPEAATKVREKIRPAGTPGLRLRRGERPARPFASALSRPAVGGAGRPRCSPPGKDSAGYRGPALAAGGEAKRRRGGGTDCIARGRKSPSRWLHRCTRANSQLLGFVLSGPLLPSRGLA